MAAESRIENIPHQRRLSAAGNSAHYGKRIQRELHRYILEIVLHSTLNHDFPGPAARLGFRIDLAAVVDIVQSQGTPEILSLGGSSLKDNLPAETSGQRAYVYQMVCRVDNVAVVLHHNDCVAQIAELFHYLDQAVGVSRMKAYTRLVQYVEGAYKAAAQGTYKIDPLTLAAT